MADVVQNFSLNPFGVNATGSGTANVGDTFTLNITSGGTFSGNILWTVETAPSSGTVSLSNTNTDSIVATFSGAVEGVYTFVIRVAQGSTGTGSFRTLTYTATVEAAAVTGPDPFTLPTNTNLPTNVSVTRAVQITGLTGTVDATWSSTGDAPLSGTGDGFFFASSDVSRNPVPNSAFTTTAKPITGGGTNDWLIVRRRTSATAGATNTATIDINGVTGTLSVTTTPPVTGPDPFSFTPRTVTTPGQNTVASTQITGLNGTATASIGSNATTFGFAVTSSSTSPPTDLAYTTDNKAITNNQWLHVRTVAPTVPSTFTTILSVNGVTANYEVTYSAGTTGPQQFNFPTATVSSANSVQTASAQITGLSASSTATITSNATTFGFAVSSSATPPASGYTTTAKSVSNNQYVHVRVTGPAAQGMLFDTMITINGVIGSFIVNWPAPANYGFQVKIGDVDIINPNTRYLTRLTDDVTYMHSEGVTSHLFTLNTSELTTANLLAVGGGGNGDSVTLTVEATGVRITSNSGNLFGTYFIARF